jgi:cytochrome oxidase Cu insertion factor (SCO1/SenC/PrrC family)
MRIRGILSLWLALGGTASAELLPPESSHVVPRRLVVSDDQGVLRELRGMAAGAPTLLLPIFTRCGGTCPLTAVQLKEALGKARAPFRVIVLSFDDDDRGADLQAFRERFDLPAEWLLVRSDDAAATREYFDQLGFHFMKSGSGFDHPNEAFVLSPAGAWAATLAGTAFREMELDAAWWRALGADEATPFRRLGGWLIRPEAWIALACVGLAMSLVATAVLARKARA